MALALLTCLTTRALALSAISTLLTALTTLTLAALTLSSLALSAIWRLLGTARLAAGRRGKVLGKLLLRHDASGGLLRGVPQVLQRALDAFIVSVAQCLGGLLFGVAQRLVGGGVLGGPIERFDQALFGRAGELVVLLAQLGQLLGGLGCVALAKAVSRLLGGALLAQRAAQALQSGLRVLRGGCLVSGIGGALLGQGGGSACCLLVLLGLRY